MFLNWIKWCFICKEILPFCVGLVSFKELTQEEYDFPANFIIEDFIPVE